MGSAIASSDLLCQLTASRAESKAAPAYAAWELQVDVGDGWHRLSSRRDVRKLADLRHQWRANYSQFAAADFRIVRGAS
jgi:hypothetical protein